MKQVQFRLVPNARHRRICVWAWCGRQCRNERDGKGDLGDVVLDQEFRACKGAVEESRSSDVAEVSDKTRANDVDERDDIVFFAGDDYGLEALMDKTVVVVFGGWVLAPRCMSATYGYLSVTTTTSVEKCRTTGHSQAKHPIGRLLPPTLRTYAHCAGCRARCLLAFSMSTSSKTSV